MINDKCIWRGDCKETREPWVGIVTNQVEFQVWPYQAPLSRLQPRSVAEYASVADWSLPCPLTRHPRVWKEKCSLTRSSAPQGRIPSGHRNSVLHSLSFPRFPSHWTDPSGQNLCKKKSWEWVWQRKRMGGKRYACPPSSKTTSQTTLPPGNGCASELLKYMFIEKTNHRAMRHTALSQIPGKRCRGMQTPAVPLKDERWEHPGSQTSMRQMEGVPVSPAMGALVFLKSKCMCWLHKPPCNLGLSFLHHSLTTHLYFAWIRVWQPLSLMI
jgi:hypothetical protein